MKSETRRKVKAAAPKYPYLQHVALNSHFMESYRTLRANIDFSFVDREFHSLLVTSTAEKEGKTTTVANLSHVMAKGNKTVLMVDADIRRPMLSWMFSHQDLHGGLTILLSEAFGTELQSGSLSSYGVSDLFRMISFQKKTGVLHLAKDQERLDIFFLNGQPMELEWLSRPEEKRLASQLVLNKMISKTQAEQALRRKRDTGQKLGFILISMGFIAANDLAGLIDLHMIEGLRTALQFKSGEFSFEKLPESYFDRPSFDPTDLALLYRQALIGEEEIPFLRKKINDSILETDTENLFVLPCGPTPPNPSELLSSNRMSFLIPYLARRYDVVIIDAPPVLPTTDPLVLAPLADGLVLVVQPGSLAREMVQKTVEQIRTAKGNLIGVVLNRVDMKRDGYYRYHKHYYNYYGGGR